MKQRYLTDLRFAVTKDEGYLWVKVVGMSIDEELFVIDDIKVGIHITESPLCRTVEREILRYCDHLMYDCGIIVIEDYNKVKATVSLIKAFYLAVRSEVKIKTHEDIFEVIDTKHNGDYWAFFESVGGLIYDSDGTPLKEVKNGTYLIELSQVGDREIVSCITHISNKTLEEDRVQVTEEINEYI